MCETIKCSEVIRLEELVNSLRRGRQHMTTELSSLSLHVKEQGQRLAKQEQDLQGYERKLWESGQKMEALETSLAATREHNDRVIEQLRQKGDLILLAQRALQGKLSVVDGECVVPNCPDCNALHELD